MKRSNPWLPVALAVACAAGAAGAQARRKLLAGDAARFLGL